MLSNISQINSIADISDHLLDNLQHLKRIIGKDFSNHAWERQPLQKLVKMASCLNTQRAAPAIERWIGTNLQLQRSPTIGDFVSDRGDIIEFKYSILSGTRQLRFLQLRPHQPIDMTFLMGIDLAPKFNVYCFSLNREAVRKEIERRPSVSHGNLFTLTPDREFTLSLEMGSAEFKRWSRLYRDRDLEEHILTKNHSK
jgi:peptidoglycan/xylan/chitin deacetylase (PgdA/CDA1 family)